MKSLFTKEEFYLQNCVRHILHSVSTYYGYFHVKEVLLSIYNSGAALELAIDSDD